MLTFALAGNPNSGKTTLFNALTGSTAHVGNWPGVTVDKRTGTYKKGSQPVDIVDLPGIYSLSPYTPEEVIARNFLLEENPDCIINIVDATNLERNLYLTTQLMELDVPMVVALNMTDVLDKRGDKIDVRMLEKRLGLPVVEISALKGANTEVLMTRAIDASNEKRQGISVLRDSVLGSAIANAEIALKLKEVPAPLFHAVKLVEKDEIEMQNHPHEARAVESFINENCQKDGFCGDAEAEIADARYKYITAHFSSTLTRARKPSYDELSKSDKADKVLTHKIWGLPIFLVILFGIFHLTFSENLLYLGSIIKPFGEWCGGASETTWGSVFFADGLNSPGVILFNALDLLTSQIGEWIGAGLGGLHASEAVIGLVVDGIWGGIASVLSFLPQILVLFLFFSILEDTGYMARVAFMLDRIFRRFGVSGRAFMPMIMGFGCSVPAMINTRTMADEREREATVRVIPFFSCGAKMPILLAISGGIVAHFGVGNADVITYSMYLLGIITALVSLLVMRHTTKRGEASPFIMELPTYHMPGFKNLMLHLWDKAKHFIQKAFTIILLSCVIIWFLSNFSWDWHYVGEEGMEYSILASIGQLIQPLFTPLGFGSQLKAFGWMFAVAAITGLIAKENVIATFGSLAAVIVAGFEGTEEGVAEVVIMIGATGISVPALISFIAFNMLTIPCFAAVAAARGETAKGKFKWTLLFWIVTSYLVAAMVYTVGEFVWPIAIWLIIAALAVVGIVLYNKRMDKKERQAKQNKLLK
ncbi:MAG: ferrous iron transporter B [Clostridia bacterium]|nr:ferrous iron transporter B [Clostridia bacterium]